MCKCADVQICRLFWFADMDVNIFLVVIYRALHKLTHPDYASRVEPLFACGGKRVKKFQLHIDIFAYPRINTICTSAFQSAHLHTCTFAH